MAEPPDPESTYLDHAATTPMLEEPLAVTTELMRKLGNASSLHAQGREARRIVEESRETVAAALGARPSDVVFTSGGTESDNLAVKGLYWKRRDADPRRTRVLSTTIEHHAVLDSLQWLSAHQDAEVELLPVDHLGRLRPEELRESIARDPVGVAAVSVMWANNEVGTVQPIADVVRIAAEHGIPVHSDAVQALGKVPVDFAASGVDALTVTGHKIGGPPGVGALVVRREVELVPVLHGGGQERDVRSGTLNVAGIAGLASAVQLAVKEQPRRAAEMTALRDDLVRRVREIVPDVALNGDPDAGPDHRLPGIVHLTFPGCEGDLLLMLLDAQGIACSTGSACSAGVPQASHVLLAMGYDEARARGSLRFSLGHTTTTRDIDRLVEVLPAAVARARAAGFTSSAPVA